MNRYFWSLATISFLLLQISLPINAQTSNVRYRIEDLGALPGENPNNSSYANGINSIGQVCGTVRSNSGNYFPFRWTNGTMQNLGSLGGINDRFLGATDINDFGFVTGSLKNANNKTHAFLYNNSELIDLGVGGAGFPSGGDETEARGINNRGEIVGFQRGGNVPAAFYYDGTTLRNLNSLLPAGSGWNLIFAFEINENRQIVGGNRERPFRFDLSSGNIVNVGMANPPSSSSSNAVAVNNLGKSVGFMLSDPSVSAFVHQDNTGASFLSTSFSPCSSNSSSAKDVNTRGTIVGSFYPFSSGPGCNLPLFQSRAVLWLPSGQGFDLNNLIDPALGWTLKEANAVNDRGQIVGYGIRIINGVGAEHAFRLTPIRPENNQVSDFDGDGRTDFAVYRPNGGFWYQQRSSDNSFSAAQFGISTDKLASGDYDGDGRTDLAVYRDGTWYISQSSNGQFHAVAFGLSSDVPVPADYDADGKTDVAVWRQENGVWYILRSSDNSFAAQQFGQAGDKPATGDYDADGRADYAVFRPSNGVWYVLNSTLGFTAVQFGASGDRVARGDYDGDGRTDFAVFRPSNSTWYVLRSTQGFFSHQFGASEEIVPGDYDGDGKFDMGVFSGGTWSVLLSSGGLRGAQFGSAGDKPIPAAYNPAAN